MKVYICFEKLKSYEGDGGEVVKVVATEELANQWSCEQLPSDVDWRGWEVYEIEQGCAEEEDDSCPHCSGTGEGLMVTHLVMFAEGVVIKQLS